MPLNMKNINNFTQWKNVSVDVTFTPAIMHQINNLALSGRSTWSAADIFNTLRVFTKELIENKKLGWSVWKGTNVYFYVLLFTVLPMLG